MGMGGLQNSRGGHVKFYPYEKGEGGGKSFSHAEGGGHKKFRGSFNTGAWSISHNDGGGGTKSFQPFKGGAQKVLPCLEVGAQKVLDPRFSHFVAPLPIINDQSLSIKTTF